MGQIFAIAKITFLQIIRQGIYGVLLALALGVMALAPSVAAFTLKDDNKMLQDLCLSTVLITGLMLAAFAASGVISAEIEGKTILTIISKPVNRFVFIVGKFVGIFAALALAQYLQTVTFLMVLRHGVLSAAWMPHDMPILVFGLAAAGLAVLIATLANYLFDWQFAPMAILLSVPLLTLAAVVAGFFDEQWSMQSFGHDYSLQIIWASVLLLLAVWVLAGVCVVCSTRLNIVWTSMVALVILCMGMTWDYYVLPKLQASVGTLAHTAWAVLYAVVPNFQLFWMIDALDQGQAIPPMYVLQAAGYAGLYILATLFLASSLFHTRQVG